MQLQKNERRSSSRNGSRPDLRVVDEEVSADIQQQLQEERLFLTILAAWGLGSMWSGLLLAGGGRLPLRLLRRRMGQQFAAWGLIDALLAANGLRDNLAKEDAASTGRLDASTQGERRWLLERILWANAALDLLYVLGGSFFARQRNEGRRGMGLGILVQGAFLLCFDTLFALRLMQGRQAED